MKKSQVGIEFLYFVGVAIIILIVYLGLSSTYLSFTTDRKNTLAAQSLLEQIRNEINLAGRVEDGYSRTIKLPNQINNKPYNMVIEGREISIEFPIGKNTYARILSTDVNSIIFTPGNTYTITKNNNIVTIS